MASKPEPLLTTTLDGKTYIVVSYSQQFHNDQPNGPIHVVLQSDDGVLLTHTVDKIEFNLDNDTCVMAGMVGQAQRVYDSMPQTDKDKFWKTLTEIFKWRGWDRGVRRQNPRYQEVDALADLFSKNGLEFEEYT